MLETMLFLANRGVECLRLDAVPFMWKELGTSCENRPEAHLLLQAFRAFVGMAAPATIFKAEAIVAPWELTKYLGADAEGHAEECQIAYNNQLMVVLWSALAERQASLATASLERLRAFTARDDVGDVRPRARRHRLGGDGRERRRRRASTPSSTAAS